jgi:hypothetical protein
MAIDNVIYWFADQRQMKQPVLKDSNKTVAFHLRPERLRAEITFARHEESKSIVNDNYRHPPPKAR